MCIWASLHPLDTLSASRPRRAFPPASARLWCVLDHALAVHQQIAVLEGTTRAVLDKKATSNDIQMITSLVLPGVGIGILTSLDVITEVRAGLLSFTRITDPVLRPMTLACALRTPPADICRRYRAGRNQSAFSQLAYPAKKVPLA